MEKLNLFEVRKRLGEVKTPEEQQRVLEELREKRDGNAATTSGEHGT